MHQIMKTNSPPQIFPGENIVETLERLPFLNRFLFSMDDYDRYVQPVFVASAMNTYLGEEKFVNGQPINLEALNYLLRFAWKKGDV